MESITSSLYSFEQIRTNDFLYVDKTGYIWELIHKTPAMFFLSRPRRFGKSLTLSTLKALFEGKKELFKGLTIYDKSYDWKKYPVIHLDFGDCDADSPETVRKYLAAKLEDIVHTQQLDLVIDSRQLSISFSNLITEISKDERAVILIDEYDKPLLENMTSPDAGEIRDILGNFYSSIKTQSASEHFVFITGVTKFCHVSLFSKLNNLTDISSDQRFAPMPGYTQEELEKSFGDRISAVAQKHGITESELKSKLKQWYDGFCFAANAESVYNPVSIAKFFERGGEFENYWFSTGTPSFLMELAKKTDFDFERVLTNPVTRNAFDAYEIDRIDPLVLLVQTGYLTIKDSSEDFGTRFYTLDFPNQEVASSFKNYLLNAYTPYSTEEISFTTYNLARSIRNGDVDGFMNIWKTWMSKIPYDIQLRHEKYYQTIFYMMFLSLRGIINEAECRTNKGRIDAVVGHGEWIYLVEFKLDKNADQALAQIKQNSYFEKYFGTGKHVVLIGANVDYENRDLSDWKVETFC